MPASTRFIIAGFVIALTGCASSGIHQSNTHVTDHGMTAISYPESHRVAFMKRNGNIEHLCAGAGIDVASSSVGGFSLDVAGNALGSDSIGDTHESVGTSLGGRNAAVLIIREILYRTCEISMNYELDADQALALFQSALQTVQSVSSAQTETGTEAGEGPAFLDTSE